MFFNLKESLQVYKIKIKSKYFSEESMDDYSDEEFSKSVSFKNIKQTFSRKDLKKINKYAFQLLFLFNFSYICRKKLLKFLRGLRSLKEDQEDLQKIEVLKTLYLQR